MKALVTITIFSLLFIYLVRWTGTSGLNYRLVIQSDGNGYYHYYESFLGRDTLRNQKENGRYLLKTNNGNIVNKYFVGPAFVQSPFVIPVYLYKSIDEDIIDFYDEGFQKAISLAALFYLLLGFWALRKLLKLFNIDDRIIAFTIFALFFGTNLSYYSLIEPSMSHVYSFSFISVFLYLFKDISVNYTKGKTLLLALVLGLMLLIRPVNILIILALPMLFPTFTEFWKTKKKLMFSFPTNVLSALILLSLGSIQLLAWYAQTGDFIVWSYSNEGFYFLNPELYKYLFSFRKGLFIYTPFVLISLFVYILGMRKYKYKLFYALGFVLFLFYFLSSWWNWYYGDSYGSRVVIDYLSIMALLFAIGMQNLRIKTQRIIVVISALFIILNGFQTYQYHYFIMSRFDMTAEKYAYIFGKYSDDCINILGGNDDMTPYHTQNLENIYTAKINLEDRNQKYLYVGVPLVNENNTTFASFAKGNAFGLSFKFPAKLFYNFQESYLELSNTSKLNNGNLNKVFWTISYINRDFEVYHYRKIKINAIPLEMNNSRSDTYRLRLQKPMNEDDIIQISIWNYSKADFLLGDLELKINGIVK